MAHTWPVSPRSLPNTMQTAENALENSKQRDWGTKPWPRNPTRAASHTIHTGQHTVKVNAGHRVVDLQGLRNGHRPLVSDAVTYNVRDGCDLNSECLTCDMKKRGGATSQMGGVQDIGDAHRWGLLAQRLKEPFQSQVSRVRGLRKSNIL